MFSEPQNTGNDVLCYNYFVMQKPVFEEGTKPSFLAHVYDENEVLYCATANENGLYWYVDCLNNPLKYADPSGEKWKYLNPLHWLDEGMQLINNKTTKLRQKMVKLGIPSFGAGYNTSFGSFHYIGNSGNMYHELSGQIAEGEQRVEQNLENVRQAYGDAWMEASYPGVAQSQGASGVFFMQAEGRIVCPIGELGFTTSIQAGIIFDANFNVAAYVSPSLGGSSGGGYFYGVSVGYFPNAKSVSEIKGWGASAGAIYAVGRSFGIEGNTAIGVNNIRLGATLSTPISGGFGGAGYAEFSYSFMTNPVNVQNMSSQGFASFLNNNLPNSNYSANDALQILQYMYNTINP